MIKTKILSTLILIYLYCIYIIPDHCYSQKIPRQYIAYKTEEKINIDGKGYESSWKKAKWSDSFIDIEGIKKPKYNTKMKMLWDNEYLYVYVKLEEPHIWGNLYQRDTVIFYNNDIEFFIDPDGDTYNYMEIEVNALNTIWDLFLTKPYLNNGLVLDHWNVNGLLSAVYINGTINNPKDKDKYWSIEIGFPWDALTEATKSKSLPVNQYWRINLSRVNWDYDLINGKYSRKKNKNGKYKREYNWVWSPQFIINMHKPEHWGFVFFSSNNVDNSIEFKVPDDESIKRLMYNVYRKINLEINNNKNVIDEYKKIEKIVNHKRFYINLTQENSNWYLWVISPFTNKKLIINENGKYFEQKK